jgi:type IV pilus assembly protein PilC
MAAVAKKPGSDAKQFNFSWTGKDKAGKVVKGEVRAPGESAVAANLRRQGIQVTSVKKVRQKSGKKITDKDITIFTRQLAVMMKAGVPLLQAFDIVGRGHANPSVGKLLLDIKTDVETGSSLGQAFRSSATWCPRARRRASSTPCWSGSRRTRKRSSPSRARSSPRSSTRSPSSWWRWS